MNLHVFIFPRSFWTSRQYLAYHETVHDATSVGFVRVEPDLVLKKLREQIRSQWDTKEIPEHFVFLKSAGRSLTRVKASQEADLTVENFFSSQVSNLRGETKTIR